ncbi:fructosamine kinase family protein [Sinomicrobium soli]|uniref:fructosamine kinase family protein n=1 Tax=Sinomicrobium sp. N-1-3-6 TaxID=2219864 RepID=UPI001374BD48|nr:fructosamine kinase family protein [Sinomicrobium sp. N-1-3-6]
MAAHPSQPVRQGISDPAREELWQLYYLLEHLNLFGKFYFPAVKRTVDKFGKQG